MKTKKYDGKIPENYQNLSYYLKTYTGELPEPPLHPATKKVVTEADLAPLFPKELISQEMTLDQYVPVPGAVMDLYRMYRPTPLLRAKRLEAALGTPAEIYFKYEGVSPVGSHKLNTALPQVYINASEGIKTLTTETGAGQWGSALALACGQFGLSCKVFMVKTSYEQKPYRKTVMRIYGAEMRPSPSSETVAGRVFLSQDPKTPGSLGMAISEAIEIAMADPSTHYALGSVLNHVLLHQTIIGQEAVEQLAACGADPDVIVGCVGGGSNFAGIAFPFLADQLQGKRRHLRVVAVEPEACPSLTKGIYRYDCGDTAGLTLLLKMYTLGSDFVPSPIHAGGLRYHGAAPLVSFLYYKKLIEAYAYDQQEVFDAALLFAKSEGIIPAPESSHAIRHVIFEAGKAKAEGKKKVLLFNLSGHGLLDLGAYEAYIK